ncbi:MAG: glycosyltransferase, partial [Armatimonadetes bacterium]|nr:glycosyltransferase [Armatimonadota bacterium]
LTLVQNFPIVTELKADGKPFTEREARVVYVGGISPERGMREMVEAMSLVRPELKARMTLIGGVRPGFEKTLAQTPGWNLVDYLGPLGRQEVAEQLSRSIAGMVLFLPFRNHVEAQPSKMFEYMSAGLPVIASDFEHWRTIMDPVGCGWNLDPSDPRAIAGAIETAIENRAASEAKGRAGMAAVEQRYNWDVEFKKLVDLYDRLLQQRRA